MRKFLCLFTGLGLPCLLSSVYVQNNARTFQEESDDIFSNLDQSYVTSNILYNRVLPNA